MNIGPDVYSEDADIAEKVDYIHRRTSAADIYFLRNKTDHDLETGLTFRVKDRVPELWHPDRGETERIMVYEKTETGTRIPLRFGPLESYFILFTEKGSGGDPLKAAPLFVEKNGPYAFKTADGRIVQGTVENLPEPITLTGPWEVRFEHGWGAPTRTTFPELISWTHSDDEGIRHYSGIASYHTTFMFPEEWMTEDDVIQLDLGRVEEVAEVFLNGKPIRITWYPPHSVDITDAVKEGENRLIIEVANVLNNQLVMDAQRPAEYRRLKSNINKLPNAWMHPMAEAELRESGLMGPVEVRCLRKVFSRLPGP
jgi:hypothetical protein